MATHLDAEFERQRELLTAGVSALVPRDEFEERLRGSIDNGTPLRVKLGVDPTASRVTLGWAVVLRRLRRFQDLGHTAVLIIGDFTARVGDPSGRSKTRPRLSKDEVDAYAESCLGAVTEIVSSERLEVRRNSEWLGEMEAEDFLWLAAHSTVARMLERDDFSARFEKEAPISLIEFIYPLLQAYDSVKVEADIELGGNDQLFNLLMGREIQRAAKQRPQACLTMPLLRGLDGVQKMSQSLGNYIAIDDEPADMYGKVMSIPDELIGEYFQLATDLEPSAAEGIVADVTAGVLAPRDAKRRLARQIVGLYHSEEGALTAEGAFDAVFVRHELPQDVPEFNLEDDRIWIIRLLSLTGLAASNSEARRLIGQGGVRIDGIQVDDPDQELPAEELSGKIVSVGKRRNVRIVS